LSFDGKLGQKYSYKNYQNWIIGVQITVENVGDASVDRPKTHLETCFFLLQDITKDRMLGKTTRKKMLANAQRHHKQRLRDFEIEMQKTEAAGRSLS